MADSVVRLKVESQEYDQKLKRAQEGLTRYADECRKVGGTLEYVEKDTLEYVRSLGQMETVSRTATGKLAELKKTFTELSVVYKDLSKEEKQSPFGKALSSSLDQLKVRINDSKAQLDDIKNSLNGGSGLSGALDSIASKFGMNISQLTKFGSVVGVTTTALQVAKDAFFQSESGIDEWGRTVEGAKGAYNIFLDTLNNGNWSNFFENLQTAIKGGRDLYDIFDRLGSIKSNNAAAIAIVQQQIAQLRLAKQQGENVDAQLKEATARLAQLQKQSITAGKAAGSKSAFEVIRNGVNSVGGAGVNDATINYVIDRIMKNGQSEFDKFKNNYNILQQKGMVTRTQTINDSQGGTYERQYKVFDINALTKEQQKQYSLAKAITEGETRIQKGIAAYAQAVQEGTASAREEFKGNRYALQGSGGGGGGKNTPEYIPLEGSIDAQTKKVQELQKVWRAAADDDSRERIKKQIDDAQLSLDYMTGKAVVAGSNSRALGYTYGEMFDQQHLNDLNNIVIDLKTPLEALESELKHLTQFRDSAMTGEQWRNRNQLVEAKQNEIDTYMGKGKAVDGLDLKKIGDKMQGLSGGLASLTGGLKQMGIDIPQEVDQVIGVIQGLSTIIQGVQSVIQIFSTSSQAANTIALTANTAALWAVAATNAIPFAGGGIIPHAADGYFVPGNNFSGDITPIMANAGELVLNRAQQGNLASQLQGGGMGGWKLTTKLAGTDLLVSLERTLQKQGYGRLATWQ